MTFTLGAAFVDGLARFVREERARLAPHGARFGLSSAAGEWMMIRSRPPFYIDDVELVFLFPGKKMKCLFLDGREVTLYCHGKDPDTVTSSPYALEEGRDRRLDVTVTNLDRLEESLGEGPDAL